MTESPNSPAAADPASGGPVPPDAASRQTQSASAPDAASPSASPAAADSPVPASSASSAPAPAPASPAPSASASRQTQRASASAPGGLAPAPASPAPSSSASSKRLSRAELIALRSQIGASLVSDVMDAAGLRDCVLGGGYRPLSPQTSLVGYAFPVQWAAVTAANADADPYSGLLAALDDIGEGEVWVSAGADFGHVASWGELMTTAVVKRGSTGAVLEGLARDVAEVLGMDFPLICKGTAPTDMSGRALAVAHRVPVNIDGVTIAPGDLIVGDDDGVVIVPADRSGEIIAAALVKSTSEGDFRRAVSDGVPPSEAYARFGVL